jgi:CheY-like chemotaxis protein
MAVETQELVAGQRERVLVVEDEPAVRNLVVTLLEDLGYEVFQAANGAQALAVLEDFDSIQLVLSDVALPGGLSGYGVLSEARRARPGIKALLMSGYPAGSHKRDDEGATGEVAEILHKPFKRADLARKIRSLLESEL